MRLGSWEKGKRWLEGIKRPESNRLWRGKKYQIKNQRFATTVQVKSGFLLAATSSCFEGPSSIARRNDTGIVCLHAGLSEPQLARRGLKPGACWQNCCYYGRIWMNFTLTPFPFSLVDVYTSKCYSPVFWSVQASNLTSVAENPLSSKGNLT